MSASVDGEGYKSYYMAGVIANSDTMLFWGTDPSSVLYICPTVDPCNSTKSVLQLEEIFNLMQITGGCWGLDVGYLHFTEVFVCWL